MARKSTTTTTTTTTRITRSKSIPSKNTRSSKKNQKVTNTTNSKSTPSKSTRSTKKKVTNTTSRSTKKNQKVKKPSKVNTTKNKKKENDEEVEKEVEKEEKEEEKEEKEEENDDEEGDFDYNISNDDLKKYGKVVNKKFTSLNDIMRHIYVLEQEFYDGDFEGFPPTYACGLKHKFRGINYEQKELTSKLVEQYHSIVEDMRRYYAGEKEPTMQDRIDARIENDPRLMMLLFKLHGYC